MMMTRGMTARVGLVAGVACGLLAVVGCASSGGSAGSGAASASATGGAGGAGGAGGGGGGGGSAADPVRSAKLRELGLEVLEAAAAGSVPVNRANALEALEMVPNRARPWVRRGLQDPNPGVRSIAAMVAGRGGMTDLDAELRSRVNDESPYVRLSVLFALISIGEEADRSDLAAALFDDNDPRLRAHAAFILGELGNRSALPMLRQAVNEPMMRADASQVSVMRQQMAEAMIKLGDEGPLAGLRAALYPSRPEDLEQTALAVQIIGAVGDRASLGQLIYLSASVDGERFLPPEVRLGIAQAAARMGRTEGVFLADEYADHEEAAVREQVAHVYGWTLGPDQPGPLLALLEDPAARVRLAAAAGLVRITSARGVAEVR